MHQDVSSGSPDAEKRAKICSKKLSTVYHASMALGCGLAVLIDVSDEKAPANIYLGVRQNPASQGIDNHDLTASGEALERGMESNFPGLKLEELETNELRNLLCGAEGAFCTTQSAIASVSCVASSRDKSKTENKDFIQGNRAFYRCNGRKHLYGAISGRACHRNNTGRYP